MPLPGHLKGLDPFEPTTGDGAGVAGLTAISLPCVEK